MRTAFQISFFIAYLAALAWGGWYVLSGQMVEDREAVALTEQTDGTRGETVPGDGDHPPPEDLDPGSGT